MSKNELLDLLTAMLEHYKSHPNGSCKIMSLGSNCQCRLCVIENAITLVKTIENDAQIQLKLDIFVKPVIPVDFIELRLV